MAENDQRERVVLGLSLALCFILVVVALSGIRGSASFTSPAPAMAQPFEQTSSRVEENEANVAPPVFAEIPVAETPAVNSADVSSDEQCAVSGVPLGYGSFGDDIFCLQAALAAIELLPTEQNGLFDEVTLSAVTRFQSLRNLLVDGIVGRKTGMQLGIWPLDPFTVERTPVPPPGAVDLWGLPLSSVATSGPDAPPLPANSGSGYRLVFDRAAQRVWAVDENETVIRSWLVSGSREDNELPGIHRVYSRSKTSVSRDGESYFSYMVRWLKTRNDAIGFHSLPRRTVDDSWYQSEDELGIRLSSGCQRQADLDAQFTWQFAPVGTTVVVL